MADKVYNESMCEEVRQLLTAGKSIARVATNLGVCRDTIYQWRDKHPEFARALSRGKDASQAYWEDRGEDGTFGDCKNFSATSWIFTMKNRFREDYAEDKDKNAGNASLVEQILGKLVE
jgi:hypothetical protein